MLQTDLEAKVEEKLTEVDDPCSCNTGNPVNIVNLGLVDDVTIDGGHVHVDLLLTSPKCDFFLHMCEDIKKTLGEIEGVDEVGVIQVTDKFWLPDRMSDEEQKRQHERFQRRVEALNLEPVLTYD